MSDEEPTTAPAAEETPAAPEPIPEPTAEPAPPAPEPTECTDTEKKVSFDSKDLTFDEAQLEIDEIKARAGAARQSLRASSECGTTSTPSYTHTPYTPSSAPRNMLSHLNSHSAMLQYKVQTARSLVRKQEDLLRNLARMRENMERSEVEISKASDYYCSPRYYSSRRVAEHKVRAATVETTPAVEPLLLDVERSSEIGTVSPSLRSPVAASVTIAPIATTSMSRDYEPEEDFEREMAAIRKRVSDLGRQANEVTKPRLTSDDYLYDTSLTSSYLRGYGGDIYSRGDTSRYERSMQSPAVQSPAIQSPAMQQSPQPSLTEAEVQ